MPLYFAHHPPVRSTTHKWVLPQRASTYLADKVLTLLLHSAHITITDKGNPFTIRRPRWGIHRTLTSIYISKHFGLSAADWQYSYIHMLIEWVVIWSYFTW